MAYQLEVAFESAEDDTMCDGCMRTLKAGERYITNIESCCGGCVRSLCAVCIAKAHTDLLIENPEPVGG